MRDADRKERPLDLILPERGDFKQFRVVRREVVFLPDEGTQHMSAVRLMVLHFRRDQPVSGQHKRGLAGSHFIPEITQFPRCSQG